MILDELLVEKSNIAAQISESVGMSKQYDFIYSYTSRLLHATPVSFYTNQKNLEVIEMLMFLDYVYVSLLDIVELTGQFGS